MQLRACAGEFKGKTWSKGERGIVLSLVSLMCERGKLTLDTTILATISLHALARRLARGWDNSIDTILGEFKLIAGRADTLIEAAGEFAVAVPDGRWVGKVIEAVRSEDRSELCLRIQTFKHA